MKGFVRSDDERSGDEGSGGEGSGDGEVDDGVMLVGVSDWSVVEGVSSRAAGSGVGELEGELGSVLIVFKLNMMGKLPRCLRLVR